MPASKAQRAKTAERRAKAIAMKLAGIDYETIAQRLEYRGGRGAVCKDISRALAQNLTGVRETVDELREMELMRLDRLQSVAWQLALGNKDLRAVETILKIMGQRLKYVPGLEAPTGAEAWTIDHLDAAIAAAEDELRRLGEAGEAPPPATPGS